MSDGTPGVSERLCRYAVSLKFDDIPGEVIERTKQTFLDFLAVGFGGHEVAESTGPVTESVDDLVRGAAGTCTVLGEPALYPPQYAALLNGTYAHSMDFDDTHQKAVMHPGVTIFATLLALGEDAGASGRDFLEAAVVGYDAANKIGIAHGAAMHERGFHPTATTGIFGCTLAGASLLGLTLTETQNAFGLNVSQSAGRHQFRINSAWDKRLHTGLAAHNAILALSFARRGYLGSREPIEGQYGYFTLIAGSGRDPALALEGLGTTFEVMNTATKPYPCCRCSHSAIDAILAIVSENGLGRGDIEAIDIKVGPHSLKIVGDRTERKTSPANVVDAQFSLYFAAAAAAGGEYNWQSYRQIGDAEVMEFMKRVTVAAADDLTIYGCDVRLTARDGRTWTARRPFPKGEPEAPMSTSECESKFCEWAEPVLGRRRTEGLARLVAKLESIENFSALSRHLRIQS